LSESFEETHDRYLEAWQHAFATGEASQIEEFLAEGYHGVFAASAAVGVTFDASEGLAGVRASTESLRGATQEIGSRVLGQRDDGAVCVFYAKTVAVNGRRIAAFVVENWLPARDGRWKLCRETVEHGVSPAAAFVGT
jgi:hypothetical protein